MPSHELANRGLVRTFQRTRELTTMTVTQNVRLAAQNHPGEHVVNVMLSPAEVEAYEADIAERASELIEFFDLDHLAEDFANSLSGGQRKLLEMARTLMLEPDLLMLDEVFAGINPTLTKNVMDHIRVLNDDGMTFLIIEHEIQSLAELADRMIVLDRGQVLASGPPEEVMSDDRVIDAYLGGTV